MANNKNDKYSFLVPGVDRAVGSSNRASWIQKKNI